MYKIILLLVFIVPIFGAELKNVTIVLPWKHQFQFAGYYAAKELGLYKKAGLNVSIIEYDLIRNNSADVSKEKYTFGVGHSYLVLDKINKFDNLRFLGAIHQSSPLILLSLKDKNINTINDVKNKKIMMSSNQKHTASINAMLYSQNLRPTDINIVGTSFTPLNLINSSADMMIAYSSNEPYILKSKGIDYTMFSPKDYGYDFYSDILFTSKETIDQDPELVKAFYEASMSGWVYAYENIDKTVDIILGKYNTQNKTKQALLFEAHTLKKLAFKDGLAFGDINIDKIKEIINTYRLLKLTNNKSVPKFNEFIYDIEFKNSKVYFSNTANNYQLFTKLLIDYKYYIYVSSFLILITIFIALYFRNKLYKKLNKKMKELDKNYEIFDKNISAVRTDLRGNITYVTKDFCETSGFNKAELLGKNPRIFQATHTLENAEYKNLWLTITSGHTWRGEFKNIKKDGTEYWSEAVISPILDDEDNIVGYEGIRKDITLKKVLLEFNKKLELEVLQRTEELNLLAITDKLTSLYNRVQLDKELITNINNFKRYKINFSIIIIDIDFFKNINDTYGHLVGDDVLIDISNMMKESIRNTDIIGRWGGEEFMIICPNTDEDGAYKLAQYISNNISEHKFETIGQLTVSCGVSQVELSSNELNLINKADKALYRAKELGRNRVEK